MMEESKELDLTLAVKVKIEQQTKKKHEIGQPSVECNNS